jgi:hypothetical protein
MIALGDLKQAPTEWRDEIVGSGCGFLGFSA